MRSTLIISAYFAAAFLLQRFTGDFPQKDMAFPLNLITAALWLCTCLTLWKYKRTSAFVRHMLSAKATFLAIGMFLISCIYIGMTGQRVLTGTWVFIAMLLYLMTVLLFVTLRGYRTRTLPAEGKGKIRWRFLLLHTGLLLTIASAFWGAPDSTTLRMMADKGEPRREAHHMNGRQTWLPYGIRMEEFIIDTYENGSPAHYEALLEIDGKSVSIRVNHPYPVKFGEDIYLVDYDKQYTESPEYCILEIVYEPWKYGALAGIIMIIAGAFMLFIKGPQTKERRDVQ